MIVESFLELGPLAMLPSAARPFLEILQRANQAEGRADVKAPMAARAPSPRRAPAATSISDRGPGGVEVRDGVALIEFVGPATKYGLPVEIFGQNASYVATAEKVRAAAANPAVGAIELTIESPGGSSYGLEELADAVFEARRAKPTLAIVDGLAASAAYYVAAQADRIVARRGSIVGGIGVFVVLLDASGLFERAGLKLTVIRAGEGKGRGVFGTAVGDSDIALAQRMVDEAAAVFVADVARGRKRGIAEIQPWADGSPRYAADALKRGMVDEIGEPTAARAAIQRDPRFVRWAASMQAESQRAEQAAKAEAERKAEAARDAATIREFDHALRIVQSNASANQQQVSEPEALQQIRTTRPQLWADYAAAMSRQPGGSTRAAEFRLAAGRVT